MIRVFNGQSVGPFEADPHGQAALFLVESLIHGLTAKSALTVPEAISIAEVALDTQLGVVDENPTSATAHVATELLTRIVATLQTDLP